MAGIWVCHPLAKTSKTSYLKTNKLINTKKEDEETFTLNGYVPAVDEHDGRGNGARKD